MTRAYGPHREADAPTTFAMTFPRSAPIEAPVPPVLRRQRQQINDAAHASAATTLTEATELERIRREQAANDAAPFVMPRCCGMGWTATTFVAPLGNACLFSCQVCHRTLAVLDGTYEEAIDRVI